MYGCSGFDGMLVFALNSIQRLSRSLHQTFQPSRPSIIHHLVYGSSTTAFSFLFIFSLSHFSFRGNIYFHLVKYSRAPNMECEMYANRIRICGNRHTNACPRIWNTVRHKRHSSVSECDQNAVEISRQAARPPACPPASHGSHFHYTSPFLL